MAKHSRILDRWNQLMRRLGVTTKEVAERAEVKEHKLRALIDPRHKDDKAQERAELMEKVRQVIPEEEGSTFNRMVVEAQAGPIAAGVVERMRDRILELEDEVLRLQGQVRRLERKLEHHTPVTRQKVVDRRAFRNHMPRD